MKQAERLMWQSRESFEGIIPQQPKDFCTTHPELIVPVPPSQYCGVRYMTNGFQYDLHIPLSRGEIPPNSVDEIQIVFTDGKFAYQLMHPDYRRWDQWMRVLKQDGFINVMGLSEPFISLSGGVMFPLAKYSALLLRSLKDRGLQYTFRESNEVQELYSDPTLGPFLQGLDGNFVDWPYWNGHFHLRINKSDIEYHI